MKAIVALLVLCGLAFAQTPLTLVGAGAGVIIAASATPAFAENSIGVGSTGASTVSSGGVYTVYLPNPTISGNCVVGGVGYSSASGATLAVTDDKGGGSNSYTISTVSSAQSSRVLQMFRSINVGSGAQKLTLTFSGGAPSNVKLLGAAEFYNCDVLDVEATTTGASSTTGLAGSITTTVANDLLFACVSRAGTPAGYNAAPYTLVTQSNITWSFVSTDAADGSVCMYGVQTATGTINPQVTFGTATTYLGGVLALKATSRGSAAPAGKRIICVQDVEIPTTQSATTPLLLQFGCPGANLYALSAVTGSGGAGAYDITGVTDGNSNTWAQIVEQRVHSGSAGGSELWYAKNATSSSAETVSVTTSGTATVDATLQFVAMRGMSATPLAGSFQGNGHQSAAGNLIMTSEAEGGTSPLIDHNIYSASDDWIELGNGGVASNTMNGITTSGCAWATTTYTGQSVSGPSTPYQNNAWWNCAGTSTAGFTNTITESDGATAAQDWASVQAFFRSATGSTRPTVVKTAVNRVTGAGTTVTLAYAPFATGNALVIFCGRGSNASTVTLTDTAGNTITTPTANTTCATSNRMSVHFISSQVAGANIFTCTYGTSVNSQRVMWAIEMNGISSVDGTLSQVETKTGDGSGNYTSTSMTPSTATGILAAATFAASNGLPDSNMVFGDTDTNGDVSGWKPSFGSAITAGFKDSSASASECVASVLLKP